MADNYLEKRFEEVFGDGRKPKITVKRNNPSIDTLLHDNRSYRGYDKSVKVSRETLTDIIMVNTMIPTAHNQQVLRFRPVTAEEAPKVLPNIRLGASLPELHLPFPGTEPEAFIIVCSTVEENPNELIDLGISLQSMSLKAVSLGLNCIIIRALNRAEIRNAFDLPYNPVAILAVGKGAESIFLMPVGKDDDLTYYRKDGVHYVPKISLEGLII